jgi:outer membrane protein assembly factor BamB
VLRISITPESDMLTPLFSSRCLSSRCLSSRCLAQTCLAAVAVLTSLASTALAEIVDGVASDTPSLVRGAEGSLVIPAGVTSFEQRDAGALGKPTRSDPSTLSPAPKPFGRLRGFGLDFLRRESSSRSATDTAFMRRGAVAEWPHLGGNAQRNGRTTGFGPNAAQQLWSNTSDYSIISYLPVISGTRVFTIRQSGFPDTTPNDMLVALDLETGAVLWRVKVPYSGNPSTSWIAFVLGAKDGLVFTARSGSGRSTPIYAHSAATGDVVWTSQFFTDGESADGIVFAPNGDLIVTDYLKIARLRAADGTTVWSRPRICSVSGSCGAAIGPDGLFLAVPVPGVGLTISKYDLDTGELLYISEPMPGTTVQNAPFLSPDGRTVYLARTQSNTLVDKLYAFADTGEAFALRWSRPIRWTTSHEHGVADDGSIYTFLPSNEFVRLDAATGNVVASAGVLLSPNTLVSPQTAIAADGTVYVSNGWANIPDLGGRIWAFDASLATSLFTLQLDRQNAGGPSLGGSGTLVVADRVGVRAYRTPAPACPADLDGDGEVSSSDLGALLSAWGTPGADLDGDGQTGSSDLGVLLSAWGGCQ